MGETRRVCHLVSVLSHSLGNQQLAQLTTLCGTRFSPDELELLDRAAGMPCVPCLLAAPTPVSATLKAKRTDGDEGKGAVHAGVSRLAMVALLVPMLSACGADDSEPLDVARYIADPCRSLTREQAMQIGALDEGTAENGENGPTCTWLLNGGDQLLGISYTTPLPGGLDFMYEKKKAGDYNDGYFTAMDIEGYPAVQASPVDQRAAGICDVAVGVTDDLMLSVSVMGAPGDDACQRSIEIARSVVRNLQQGQ